MPHHLSDAFAQVARAVLPDSELRQQRAVRAAVSSDGSIVVGALVPVLPLQTVAWWLPGASSGYTGTNISTELRLPQAVRVRRIDALAKVAPGSQALILRLTASGASVGTVAVSVGQSSGVSVLDAQVAAGSVLRLEMLQTGGSNISVSVAYAADVSI